MSNAKTLYWDTSCFICLLGDSEPDRQIICEDILRQVTLGAVEIWTSTWTIVEVIRPKRRGVAPLPDWANLMIEAVPEARGELEILWQRHQNSAPSVRITDQEIEAIEAMFESYTKKIELDQIVAEKAVALAREYGLKPGDAVHAASAILKKVDALQHWDKDFKRVEALVHVEEPSLITGQGQLFSLVAPQEAQAEIVSAAPAQPVSDAPSGEQRAEADREDPSGPQGEDNT